MLSLESLKTSQLERGTIEPDHLQYRSSGYNHRNEYGRGPEEPVYVADRSSGRSWKENERQEYEDSSQGNKHRRERCEGDHLGSPGNVRQDSRIHPAHATESA